MKENKEQTSCETKGSFTQVSTTYARICVILLALNFCVTGYVLTGVMKIQQETNQTQARPFPIIKVGTAAQTEGVLVETSEEIKTLGKE